MNIFKTVSFHLVKPCNMKCKFCYATFQDFSVRKQLSLEDATLILQKLYDSGVEKVTFAGGEPMLYRHIEEIIIKAKKIGLVTSIITNGNFITPSFLKRMNGHLDWIGISIDSFDDETNVKIGRIHKGKPLDYVNLLTLINKYNFKLKVNTVVNKYNNDQAFSWYIELFNVKRWKIFDTLRVEGQNDKQYDEIKSRDFNHFVNLNETEVMVVENNDLMMASYLLIDPLGRMFENSKGKHTYSDSLIDHSVKHCISQISLDETKFIERGGIYEW